VTLREVLVLLESACKGVKTAVDFLREKNSDTPLALALERGLLAARDDLALRLADMGPEKVGERPGLDPGTEDEAFAAATMDPASAGLDRTLWALRALGDFAADPAVGLAELRARLLETQRKVREARRIAVVRVGGQEEGAGPGFRPPGVLADPRTTVLAEALSAILDDHQEATQVLDHLSRTGCDRRCVRPGGCCPETLRCSAAFDAELREQMRAGAVAK